MRTEKEIYEMLLDIAANDSRIKAVYMNGSRTNPNVERDIFQDYDVVYVVEETASFIRDKEWIHKFGDILYMQYPDEHPDYPSDKENHYGWLMQFKDENRIDLTVQTIHYAMEHIKDDKLCRILLDKEGILPEIEESTDKQYYVQKPTEVQYQAVCNEFWWCTNNIAKGLWRREIPYVQDMSNFVVRKQLITMLSWKVGILTDWTVSVGKSAKYMYRWLDKAEWQEFLLTYFGSDVEEIWEAVFRMCRLFTAAAQYVGDALSYSYNQEEGSAALGYLEHVHELPAEKCCKA